jgi:hypothetical protein
MDPAIEGHGGDAKTFRVARVLVIGFGLSQDEAFPLLLEYNERCQPLWSAAELRHKLNMADRLDGPRGEKLRKKARHIVVAIRDESVVYVGVDCKGQHSYVDMSSLYAGHVNTAHGRELVPELAEIDWQGKQVMLTPPSTISTNSREVWGEFFLARLLRVRGATVKSIRLPPLNGRKRIFSQADGTETIVEPPFQAWQADEHAEAASLRARELDAERKALPRKKGRPRFWKASRFILRYGVTRLSSEVVDRAKRRGITRSSLRRALNTKNL